MRQKQRILVPYELLQKADRVMFPGQGHAAEAMEYLKARRLDEVIRDLKQPVFGICVGQQLLCKHSEEGDVDCIGIFDADVKRFQPEKHEDKVPCMGWNEIDVRGEKLEVRDYQVSPLMEGLGEHPYVYFVHSYYVPVCEAQIHISSPFMKVFKMATSLLKTCVRTLNWRDNIFANQLKMDTSIFV